VAELIGQAQSDLLRQLRTEWLEHGRTVCAIEGFPGVGKTDLAERLIAQSERKFVYVECPENDIDATADLLAHLGEKLANLGYPAMADAGPEPKSLLDALIHILSEPILIVLDEFQNTMVGQTGRPSENLAKFIEATCLNKSLQGRVLIVTNRSIERSRWSGRVELHSFPELDVTEAEHFLIGLLTKWGRLEEIPPVRRRDVVGRLGKNPRAISTLVHCLTDEPLDDLLGPNREAWDIHDPKVSSQLAAKIEEDILQRSMKHLEHESLTFLRRLCVHRFSLRREALQYLALPGSELDKLVSDLTQRFMIVQKDGFYPVHPLVHAIARQRWSADSHEVVKAHSLAVDYYSRPFAAKQTLISSRTGGQFAELRYHFGKVLSRGRSAEIPRAARR
jgi:AAA domain